MATASPEFYSGGDDVSLRRVRLPHPQRKSSIGASVVEPVASQKPVESLKEHRGENRPEREEARSGGVRHDEFDMVSGGTRRRRTGIELPLRDHNLEIRQWETTWQVRYQISPMYRMHPG